MFGGQVKGLRGADGSVKTIRDVGEYDVWSTVVMPKTLTGELQAFSYGVGASISGAGAVTANKLDTNMRTPNQFVDESMNVYGIAIQPLRFTNAGIGTGGALTYPEYLIIEAHTLFRFHVGGDKPFAEGRIGWFAEGGGLYGMDAAFAAPVIANNIPSPAAIRRWEYTLPIGRVEKFWGEFSWPRAANTALSGTQAVVVRLLGVRARGVQ